MKKYLIFILVVLFSFLLIACGKTMSSTKENIVKPTLVTNEITSTTKTNILMEMSTDSLPNIDTGGGEILPRKYRNNYYQVPSFFVSLVDKNEFVEWEREYYLNNNPDDKNIMVMVGFIKEFNISKENFEKANLEYAKFIDEVYSGICLNPQDYADQEMQEIYNTEIIYTFNNSLINEYYMGANYAFLNEYEYDEAVASGEYTPRTEVWIDVEAMEAEIIEKYGEAENVTEPINPQEVTWPPTTAEESIENQEAIG